MIKPIAPTVTEKLQITRTKKWDEVVRARQLVYKEFVSAGYIHPDIVFNLMHPLDEHYLDSTHIFIAKKGDLIVGTNTLSLDKTHVDNIPEFSKYIDKTKGRVASSFNMATLPSYRSSTVYIKLIKITSQAVIVNNVAICYFTIHPKHEAFYKKALNMTTLAKLDNMPGLHNAPVVFMKVDSPDIPKKWYT